VGGFLGFLGRFFAFGAEWAYVFSLLRTSANGSNEIEAPDFSDFFEDLVFPALRSVVAIGIIILPAAIYGRWFRADDARPLLHDPAAWVLTAIGIAYMPMALIIAASGGGILRMVNPLVVVVHALKVAGDYLLAVIATVLILGADAIANALGAAIAEGLPIPFVRTWVGQTLTVYPFFVLARVLGLLLYVRGDDLDYGPPEQYLEPALPGVEPRGELIPGVTGRAHQRAVASGPASGQSSPAAPEPGTSGSGPDADPSAEIVKAMEANDLETAVRIYGERPKLQANRLAIETHLAIGRKAANTGNYDLAVRALRAAGTAHPDHPLAPKAFLILARVYGEAMHDAGMAQRIFRFVIDRYPDSEAATAAKSKLVGA
jgi:hypothetical protein